MFGKEPTRHSYRNFTFDNLDYDFDMEDQDFDYFDDGNDTGYKYRKKTSTTNKYYLLISRLVC